MSSNWIMSLVYKLLPKTISKQTAMWNRNSKTLDSVVSPFVKTNIHTDTYTDYLPENAPMDTLEHTSIVIAPPSLILYKEISVEDIPHSEQLAEALLKDDMEKIGMQSDLLIKKVAAAKKNGIIKCCFALMDKAKAQIYLDNLLLHNIDPEGFISLVTAVMPSLKSYSQKFGSILWLDIRDHIITCISCANGEYESVSSVPYRPTKDTLSSCILKKLEATSLIDPVYIGISGVDKEARSVCMSELNQLSPVQILELPLKDLLQNDDVDEEVAPLHMALKNKVIDALHNLSGNFRKLFPLGDPIKTRRKYIEKYSTKLSAIPSFLFICLKTFSFAYYAITNSLVDQQVHNNIASFASRGSISINSGYDVRSVLENSSKEVEKLLPPKQFSKTPPSLKNFMMWTDNWSNEYTQPNSFFVQKLTYSLAKKTLPHKKGHEQYMGKIHMTIQTADEKIPQQLYASLSTYKEITNLQTLRINTLSQNMYEFVFFIQHKN